MDKYAARRDKYMRFRRDCMERANPDIIIWGPGPSDEQLYQKRECVRNAIQLEVPNGDVVFPEDPEVIKIIIEIFGSEDVDVMEQIEALNADIIIALDISSAVGEEVARYSANPNIASKLFVVTTGDKSGYQKAIRHKPLVRDLNADEMASCERPIELCVNYVRSWCVQNGFRSDPSFHRVKW